MCVLLGAGKKLPIRHIPGPEGVRGRNSDNTLIQEVLGWAPSTKLYDGLKRTSEWIRTQIEAERAAGVQADYAHSTIAKVEASALERTTPA